MAINGRKPTLKSGTGGDGSRKPVEPSDEAFERVMSKAPDYRPDAGITPRGEGRPGKGREKGKGYAMGNKRQITHMITTPLLDRTDLAAEKFGEARATVINRYIREGLERDGL